MIIAYVFTGEEERDERGRYIVPRDATHVSVHASVTVIPARLFYEHPNIVELICHDGVEKIERFAFYKCPRLKREIIRGVRVVEEGAFEGCDAGEYVECPKLERIGHSAFCRCKSLSNIDLPSVKIVEALAFGYCDVLSEARFGKNLELLGEAAFCKCISLERITIPLKYDLFTDDVFQECANLKWVDLVEGAMLHDTTTAFLLEEWRKNMIKEIKPINQILPNVYAGEFIIEDDEYINHPGEKALVIQQWIIRVLCRIIYYKGEHRWLLHKAASTLQLVLPNDIVANDVVPFLELPPHTFDGENEDEAESIASGYDDSGQSFVSEDEDGEEDSRDESAGVSVEEGDDEEQQQQQQQHQGEVGRRKMTALCCCFAFCGKERQKFQHR